MNDFAREDRRKDKLFASWNLHTDTIDKEMGDEIISDIYEGLCEITRISDDEMDLLFEDKKSIRKLRINSDIQKYCDPEDKFYLVACEIKGEWLPLHLISVGSIIDAKEGKFHVSINPRIMFDPRFKPDQRSFH
jgi:hypothetical protein